MNIMPVVLMLGIIVGFALLLYGVFFVKGGNSTITSNGISNDTLEKMQLSVEEADAALSNINSVSSLIIEEIDIKYKELLFLYQMLEEKKRELLEKTNEQLINDADVYDAGIYYEDNEFTTDDSDDSDPHTTANGSDSEMDTDSVYKTSLEVMEIGRRMDEIKRFPKLQNKFSVLDLHSKGLNIAEIARQLSIGRGEVSLILGLNKVGVGYEYE